MSGIDKSSGTNTTSPQLPVAQTAEETSGVMGDSKVTAQESNKQLNDQPELSQKVDQVIAQRSVTVAPLKNETINMTLTLIKNKSWEGVKQALEHQCQTLEHIEQLFQASSGNLSTEALALLADRYVAIQVDQIVANLTDLKGSAADQLDTLYHFYNSISSPNNAISAICRENIRDFNQNDKFDASLEKTTRKQLEEITFKRLTSHVESLESQVLSQGKKEQVEKITWLQTQRKIELGL